METTAIVELFGSFFVSVASQQSNKDELLRHLNNFKCALYSQQDRKAEVIDSYLGELERQVAKETRAMKVSEALEKFEHNNKLIYEQIQSVLRQEKTKKLVRGEES